ncbi:hypothetical protein BaRGS_00018416 [Batillaria attramentaria]|uniref:Uncharacterized protein n=1 Tax=Batillaria attramentaria TaxID=370345 RepID=A0ABD0KTU2_9CAEN
MLPASQTHRFGSTQSQAHTDGIEWMRDDIIRMIWMKLEVSVVKLKDVSCSVAVGTNLDLQQQICFSKKLQSRYLPAHFSKCPDVFLLPS